MTDSEAINQARIERIIMVRLSELEAKLEESRTELRKGMKELQELIAKMEKAE